TVSFNGASSTINTAVNTLTTTGAADLTINEADGIQLGSQAVGSLTVNAALNSAGNISTTAGTNISATSLAFNTSAANGGDIVLNSNIVGTSGVTLSAGGANGTIVSSNGATVSGGALSVTFGNSTVTLATNVDSLTTGGGSALVVNEADGIDLGAQAVGSLT